MQTNCLKFFVFSFLLLFYLSIYGQGTIDLIRTEYHDFNYSKVIELTNNALQDRNVLTIKDLKEILLMQAIAHYSLNNMMEASTSFQELLQIDMNYSLDPVLTSPKIIQFFNQIKSSMPRPHSVVSEKPIHVDTVKVLVERRPGLPGAMLRSLILPGWGHWHLMHSTKSKILMLASTAITTATVYTIIDCHSKENEYLAEFDISRMENKYQNFNNAYKLRNAFLFTCAAMWLFGQVDLLFTDDKDPSKPEVGLIVPRFSGDRLLGVSMHFVLRK